MEAQDGGNGSLRVASFSCYLDKAKESLIHRVSAQDHNNMTIKFSNKDPSAAAASGGGGGGFRVDSFSRSSDHNLHFQVPAPVPDPTAAFSFSHHAAEIGVFGADRYFKMKLQYPAAAVRRPATTPSFCSGSCSESESSSATTWNSQSTLLRPNESIQLKQKKAAAARLFTGFSCRTPCFGNKSVRINEIATAAVAVVAAPAKSFHQNQLIQKIEESRRSIEVFGSSRKIRVSKGGDVATNMERKLSMLTWDAIPVGGRNNLPTSTIGSISGGGGGDAESDGSSDLFEIEDVSGNIYPLLEGANDDEPSCVMSPAPSLCAPSEASIQWSVVTASAADFALSEFNDDSVSVAAAAKPKANTNQGQKSRLSHGLLGCKSVKAVDVANENVCVKVKNKTLIS
ncbi:protein PHYTOCHROME KINASE SUBSTRATE 3-like [Salvia divinorum]|uniref:Protein PHYTOCHROME KINASE SUBSTRATE 3-like n=1 Tax=Salvia divinorum TaxID=28513 RepID=A0ABD1FLC8_SALDI